ncbi:MAG: hypothetical protein E7576_09660 [Ruminococcaceae bacterium]|nr:hypothetical protein [Oscillospiraceae bacterium]
MTEREVVRDLARRYADIAFSAESFEKAANWGRLNALDASARPPIILDQLPWHEFAGYEDLKCVCADPFLRGLESYFRSELFRIRHFGADLVLPPFYPLGKVYDDTGCGVSTVTQDESDHAGAQTHLYVDQLPDEESLSKLKNRVITAHPEETARRKAAVEEVIGDLMEVRPTGTVIWAAIWDRITFWKGAEACLYAVIDEPEFVHAMMKRFLEIEMDAIDQLEAQNLLAAGPGIKCHCVETYVDEDRFRAIDQNHIRTQDCWIAGAAQIFSEISPAMHDEFEIEYMKPLYDRFGWVNYGCCEPLSQKIDIIRRMKTVRSISASPWTKVDMQAEAMGGDFVMLRKPNPAHIRSGSPDVDAVKKEIRETLRACRRNGTPVAFVLKDITTVNSRAEGLGEWADLVRAEIENS